MTEINLPELGENIESAEVVKVLVSVGDSVSPDQPIVEVETNKATVEVPAGAEGTVNKVHVREGDEVKVGQALLTLDAGGEEGAEARPAEQEVESGKVADEEDVTAAEQDTGKAAEKKTERTRSAPPQKTEPQTATVAAAPSVRRFARETGVDISQVRGSGPHARISVDDIKQHARGLLAGLEPTRAATVRQPEPRLPDFEQWGPVRIERMSPTRRRTAEHLTECWTRIAHVTQFDKADVTELEELRKRYTDRAQKMGGKLTMAVMVVKVVASALRVFPKFNASVDMSTRQIIYKDYIGIGIAVATERGLLVPVLREADRKNMIQIAAEVSETAEKARNGKVSVEDLQGGTFTVTNLGNIGGTHFTPIVNWPEVAILGMGRAQMEAGFENGICTPRIRLPLCLSYDHRLIDGAEGARFLRWIVEAIEEPLLLSLEG